MRVVFLNATSKSVVSGLVERGEAFVHANKIVSQQINNVPYAGMWVLSDI